MRSARVAQNSTSISLFPFLAVLLCTMGALIVILVVIAQQARAAALEEAQAKARAAAPQADEVAEQQAAELRWQIEQMRTARTKTAEELERDRLELAHREAQMRKLKEEFERLAAAAKQLRETNGSTDLERNQAEARLAQLRQEIAAAAARLEQAQRAAQEKKPSYAIIPYEGPNQTHRRPIFIECRADSVVIQPEGVTLRASDFESPLGPGNPLAAALRAAREYLTSQPGQAAVEAPYPLLLVRPDGIAAYYKAREAIESWGPDFGYELVGGDWELEFPPADAQLAQIETQAVRQGRIYQERLALAAPARYGRRTPTYRATPTRGGFVQVGGPGGNGGGGAGDGGGFGDEGFSEGGAGGGDGQTGHGYGGDGRGGGGEPLGGFADGRSLGSGGRGGEGSGSVGDAYAGVLDGGGGASSTPSAGGGSPGAVPYGQPGANSAGSGAGPGNGSGQADRYASTAGQTLGSGSRASAGQQGGGTSGGGASGGKSGGNGQGGGGSSMGQAGAGGAGGASGGAAGFASQGQRRRGNNWALPDAVGASVPVSRPVRVICRADSLVLVIDNDPQLSRIIPIDGPTDSAVDPFVTQLHQHMSTWGIAGNGMYWRPILRIQPAPGGEQRAADLAQLLDGSGIVIEDSTPGSYR